MVIERHGKSVKRVSSSRVLLETELRILDEILNNVRPLVDETPIANTFPVEGETKYHDYTTNGTPIMDIVDNNRAGTIINSINNLIQV